MGVVFSSCADEPPQSNPKHELDDDDRIPVVKKSRSRSSLNAADHEPEPGTFETMPTKSFTASAPVRDPETGGITTPITRDFRFGKVLGTGGFAVVKQCTHLRSKKSYAVKVMNVVEPTNEADLEEGGMTLPEIAEEIRLTMSLASPQVVRIYDFYQTPKHVYVLMEFLRGGELLDAVMNLGSYSEKDAAMIMKQLLTGLVKVHEQNITHRDLKLENLILAEKGKLDSLRIADFGLAKKMKTSRGKLSAQCGSPAYVAPEIILGQQYTPAVDMWAVGCILYCLLNGQLPFYEADEQAMFRRIAKGQMHPPAESVSEAARELIGQLLCADKVTRLTAAEALEHRWITGAGAASDKDGAKPINRSRMERFAETHIDAGALETRELKTGDLLIKQGARAKEIFLIREGSCEVVVKKDDGSEVKVAERHAGEFVGEMGVKLKPDGDYDVLPPSDASASKKDARETESVSPSRSPTKRDAVVGKIVGLTTLLRVKNKWVGGRRGADVRATTPMKVVVMTADQMQWILEHDYGADGEMTKTIKSRAEELRRKSLDNEIVVA